MTSRRDIEDLKALAYARAPDVLAALGIVQRVRGGYISMCNPKRKDARESFTIFVKGGTISFRDEAYSEIKGDVFGLVAYLRDWTHLPNGGFLEAKRFLEDLLGVRRLSAEDRRADAAKARRRAREAGLRDARELSKKIGRAQQVFYGAALWPGTLVETYLASRALDLSALPDGPRGGKPRLGSLRFAPGEKHIDARGRETFWPCMIACCCDPATGEVRGIHRTWLRHDGRDKAPVDPPRKVWPMLDGLVIPLWRGESRLSVPEANANGLREHVVLAEGIETALSAVLAAPQYRTWAVIALGNLQKLVLPDCIDGVLLSRENDWVKPQAVAMFEAGKAALEAQGRPVAEIRAFGGNDLNDVIRAAPHAGLVPVPARQTKQSAA